MENFLIAADPLRQFCMDAFERTGMSPEDAFTAADSLVEADLRGVHSHGTWWLSPYIERLQAGGLNPRPELRVIRETRAMVLVDADRAMGQVAGARSIELAIAKAVESGVGIAGVRNSNHFGAAAYFALKGAGDSRICIASTDAEPTMAAWGGTRLVVGNNPLACAVPTGGAFPIVLDMAMSVVAWGKIYLAAQRGEAIPSNWATDNAGRPTTDPNLAMEGLLAPMGAYKGYGLALILEILSGVLTGAVFGLQMPPMTDHAAPQGHGHFFMVLDIPAFMPISTFYDRIALLVSEHADSPLAEGVEKIVLPGEIEHLNRQKRLQSGVPLEAHIIESLARVGQKLDLDTAFLK